MEDRTDQTIALIAKLQDLPPPLTAQAKFLLLSRSLQRRLTHFSRVARSPLSLGPLAKLQTAVETAALSILNIPANPNTAASMGFNQPLVRMQLRLPLREGGFGLNATSAVPNSKADDYQRSLLLHTASFLAAAAHCHNALPFRGTLLSSPLLTAYMRPPPPTQRSVPSSVRICGVPSPLAILHCTLQRPLLCLLPPRSLQCQRIP
jgi:hypothetical protein